MNVLYGQNEAGSLFWPKEIQDYSVIRYFEDMTAPSMEAIEKAYNYALDFLYASIVAHKRNGNNHYAETT
jgi:hypothetical protein